MKSILCVAAFSVLFLLSIGHSNCSITPTFPADNFEIDSSDLEKSKERRYLPTYTDNKPSNEGPLRKDLDSDYEGHPNHSAELTTEIINDMHKTLNNYLPSDEDELDDELSIDSRTHKKGLGKMSEEGCYRILLKDQKLEDVCALKVDSILESFSKQYSAGIKYVCEKVDSLFSTRCESWAKEQVIDKARNSNVFRDVIESVRNTTISNCVGKIKDLCSSLHRLTTNGCQSAVVKLCDNAPHQKIKNKCKELLKDKLCD